MSDETAVPGDRTEEHCCRRCGTKIESFHGLWWTKDGDDFQCPDGEENHTPSGPEIV